MEESRRENETKIFAVRGDFFGFPSFVFSLVLLLNRFKNREI